MWLQIPFFCGQASPCWEEGSNWALQQAKYNLLNEYFLVGLNEQMEKFIQLLDYQLPHVFKVVLDEEFCNTRLLWFKIISTTAFCKTKKENF